MHELWDELCRRAGLALSHDQEDLLSRYIDLLLDVNQRMNLTRIDTRQSAEVLHVGDALTLLPHLRAGQLQLADVGSGGGIPGIPLAIVRPEISVTLFESTQKKASFLDDAVKQLGLRNITVIAKRAEDFARPDSLSPYSGRGQGRGPGSRRATSNRKEPSPQPSPGIPGEGAVASMRESFDVVTARALAEMSVLLEWCLPLVKIGGKLLAMKGAKIADELPRAARAIKLLGGREPRVHRVDLPGADY